MKFRIIVLALLTLVLSLTACGAEPDELERSQPYFRLENGRHYALAIDSSDKDPQRGTAHVDPRLWKNNIKGDRYDSYAAKVNVPPVRADYDGSPGIVSFDLLAGNIRQVVITDRAPSIQFWMNHEWADSIERLNDELAWAEVVLYISAEQKEAMGL